MRVTSGPPSSGRSLPGALGCPLQSLRVTRSQVHVLENSWGSGIARRRSTKQTEVDGSGRTDQFAGAAGPHGGNQGAAPLPQTPGPLRSACPGGTSIQVCTNVVRPSPMEGLRGPFRCVSGTSNTFWGSPLSQPLDWATRIHHDWSRRRPPRRLGQDGGRKPAPSRAADADSAVMQNLPWRAGHRSFHL